MSTLHELLAPCLLAVAVISCTTVDRPSDGDAIPAAPPSSRAASAVSRIRAITRAPVADPSTANRVDVELPASSAGAVVLRSASSPMTARFALRGTTDTAYRRIDDFAVAPAALDGADVVQHIRPDGIEDYVLFGAKPAREALDYDLDVSRIAGLRLVGNVLELLDEAGAPQLRVAAPYVLDASGRRMPAVLTVEGCAHDTSAAAPWGRPVLAPGRAICTLHVSWADVTYPAVLDPQWIATGALVTARIRPASVLLPSGKVLFTGGRTAAGSPLASAELYDPASKTFATTGSMSVARHNHAIASLSGGAKVLVSGGDDPVNEGLPSAELYDVSTGTFGPAGAMNQARAGHTASTLASGKVLIVGGGAELFTELYDPTSNAFAKAADDAGGIPRKGHSATLLTSGKVFVWGSPPGLADSGSVYDPVAATFTPVGGFDQGYDAAAVRLPSGKVLVTGGHPGINATKTTLLFDPATTTLAMGTPLAIQRQGHTATLLPSGKVLVVGGFAGNGNSTIAGCELYDPATEKFSNGPTLKAGRGEHSATLLPDGYVLVAAGSDGTSALSSAELISLAKNGTPCASAASCASDHCIDGVCCDTTCGNTCEACDVAGSTGTCTVVNGDPHGKRTCGASGPCNGKCNGTTTTSCTYPSIDVPCGGSCSGNTESNSTCDGTGLCEDRGPHTCEGNLICGTTACKTKCASNGDCVDGFECAPDGKCIVGAVCTDSHTSRAASGVSTDCAPYRCDTSGLCKTTCKSVVDCVAPTACDPDGHCVQPEAESTEGCSTTGRRSRWTELLVLGLVAAALRRRRPPTRAAR